MQYRELIKGLVEKAGIAGEVEIDDEERCLLEFDGFGVVIQGVDAANVILFISPVAELPPEKPERLYRALLEANHVFQGTDGATLSVNPDGGFVYLCRQLDSRMLDVDELADALDGFLNTLEAWRTFIAEYRDRPEEEKPAEDGPQPALDDGFIRG